VIRKTNKNYQPSFLPADLLEQLDEKHPLLMLANEIPWAYLEKEFRPLYSSIGRPAKPIRLMCGLMILKQMNNLSDQSVVKIWVENPYWQRFCGMREFQFKFPCTSSELTYFRKRLGEAGVEKMFAVSVSLFGKKARAKKVIIDTTVQ
jgi:IS5 family transposase